MKCPICSRSIRRRARREADALWKPCEPRLPQWEAALCGAMDRLAGKPMADLEAVSVEQGLAYLEAFEG